jgi:hypothetical protein
MQPIVVQDLFVLVQQNLKMLLLLQKMCQIQWELRSSGLISNEYWEGIATTRCVMAHKSAVLIYFAAEAWNLSKYDDF